MTQSPGKHVPIKKYLSKDHSHIAKWLNVEIGCVQGTGLAPKEQKQQQGTHRYHIRKKLTTGNHCIYRKRRKCICKGKEQFFYTCILNTVDTKCMSFPLFFTHKPVLLTPAEYLPWFNLLLTVSTWSWHHISQVKGSFPQECLTLSQIQVSCNSDWLALNQGYHKPFPGLNNFLNQLKVLEEAADLLDDWFIIKHLTP